MCGIMGYIGPREAYKVIIKGLKRLEYRGYDSAGVALINHDLKVYKKKGKVQELETLVRGEDLGVVQGEASGLRGCIEHKHKKRPKAIDAAI